METQLQLEEYPETLPELSESIQSAVAHGRNSEATSMEV
jgi:hypothetical protein